MPQQHRSSAEFKNQVVLITGASRGLGLALAIALARKGATVIATARPESVERLHWEEDSAITRLIHHPMDIADPESVHRTVGMIEQRYGGIDILINNAAITIRSLISDLADEEIERQLTVNFEGPLRLIRAVLPLMQARRRGRILNISSVGGMMAMPAMGMYSATTFATEGLTESLWYECRPYGIHVTLIEPGFTLTGGLRHVSFSEAALHKMKARGEEGAVYEAFEKFVRTLYRRFGTRKSVVVRTALKALRAPRPKLRYPATADAWFFFWLRRLLPRRLYHLILFRGLPRELRKAASARAGKGVSNLANLPLK